MIIYKYTIGNQTVECLNIIEIPEGVDYETLPYTPEQEVEISLVPQEVQLWRIRTVLKLMSLETTIEEALNQLEEPIKTGAFYIWQFGTTVERYSQTVLLLQNVLQMTEEQVDTIFTEAQNINL